MGRLSIPILLALACSSVVLPPASAQAPATTKAESLEPEFTPGRLVIHLEPGADPPPAEVDRLLGVRGRKAVPALDVVAVDLPPTADVRAAAARYRSLDGVRLVERSIRRRIASHPPNDPGFADQYHLPKIGVPDAWHTTGGGNRKIAVIDTGVKATHEDLLGRVLPGYNSTNGSFDADDDHGHGTAVSGVIVAVTNNGKGVAGISKSDKVLPVKALTSDGFGDDVDVADGIVWAADNGASIINLSLGSIGYSSVLDLATRYARSRGALVVAASGNEGWSIPNYPAALPGVLAVGATDEDDEIPFWPSGLLGFTGAPNYGSWIDVVAPGEEILTTFYSPGGPLNEYGFFTGTSLSAPVASGAAALILAANPSFTPNEVAARMRDTADDLGRPGVDRFYGHGRINVHRAVGGSPAAAPAQTEPPGEAGDTSNDGSPLDGSTLATIYPAGDQDWYDVVVAAGQWLQVIVDPPDEIDPVIELYGPDGSLVHYEDAGADGADETFKLELGDAPGTYHVGVRNWLPNGVHPDAASPRYEITVTTDTGPGAPPAAAPTPIRRSFFTWYDAVNSGLRNWLMTANVGAAASDYSATIASDDMLLAPFAVLQPIAAGDTDPQVFGGIVNGPVEARWLEGEPLIASQRVLWKPDNFEEVSAVADTDLTTHAWFTWYDGVNTGGRDWVLAANPGPWSADVEIVFEGDVVKAAVLQPGENLIWSDAVEIGGPVEVVSDEPILASRRTLWNGTNFSEFTGIPDQALATEYIFPWYDANVTKDQNWILIGNPHTTPITVNVEIADTNGGGSLVDQNFIVPSGGAVTPSFPDVVGGPVRVTGMDAGKPFLVTQRNLFDSGRSFEEVGGVPVADLTSVAFYTWYDGVNTGGRDWILVGNPSPSEIHVSIEIDGVTVLERRPVGPGSIITPNFPGTIGGPVEVTADGPVVTSRRTLWGKDFTELIGVPPPS